MLGTFSERFDLISSEYGWSDDQVFDLTVQRFNQIVAAISLRVFQRSRQENGRFSWLARSLATYVAAGYMVEGENTAIKEASNIAFDDLEAAQMSMSRSEVKTVEPTAGSFERLTRFFGQKKD